MSRRAEIIATTTQSLRAICGAEQPGLDVAETKLSELNLDSLDHISLAINLEVAFRIDIPDDYVTTDAVVAGMTLGQLWDVIEGLVDAKTAPAPVPAAG